MLQRSSLHIEIFEAGRKILEKDFSEFPVTIGRAPYCSLQLSSYSFISRQHASLVLDGRSIILNDLGSTNGVIVKGSRVTQAQGENQFEFSIKDLKFVCRVVGEAYRPKQEETQISVIRARVEANPQSPSPEPPMRSSLELRSVASGDGNSGNLQAGHESESARSRLEPAADLGHPAQEVESITIAAFPEIVQVPKELRALQAVVTWDEDIFSVHNFLPGEPLIMGNDVTEAIYLPAASARIHFGMWMPSGEARILLPNEKGWHIFRHGKELPLSQLIHSKKISRNKKNQRLIIKLENEEVLSIALSSGLKLHFRFVKKPQYVLPKTWIENKEETQKALAVSAIVHALIATAAFLLVPKSDAPKIENVPPRVAKLLVEPPNQLLATPPPPPPPEPEPEPPPPEPEPPKPEPVKPEPQKPKLAEKPKEFPKPKELPKKNFPKPAPVAQAAKNPAPAPSVNKPLVAASNPAPAAQETAAAQETKALQNLLGALPGPAAKGPGLKPGALPVIDPSRIAPAGAGGIKVSAVAGALGAAKQGVPGGGMPDGVSFGNGGGGGGPGGLSKTVEGKAGQRGVAAAVVGVPKMSADSVKPNNGLTNDVVMQVVNRYLGDIQRCYERALFQDPTIAGRVEYEWNIDPSGKVTSVRVVSSQIAKGDKLNECVMGVFRKMSFPKSTNGQPTVAKIGFPFGK